MSMLFKRFKDWAVSITSFRTGDVLQVDGPSGTAKMPYSDLAKEVIKDSANNTAATEADLVAGSKIPIMTANGPKSLPGNAIAKASEQTALTTYAQNVAHSIAPEFVPNETNAVAGMPYMYGGKLYVAKVDYNGPWNQSYFATASVNDIAATKSSVLCKVFAKEKSVQSGEHLSIEVVPKVNVGSIVVDVGTNVAEKVYGLYAKDSTGVNPQKTLHLLVPSGEAQDYTLPVGYDTLLVFTPSTYDSSDVGRLYFAYRDSVEYKVNSKIDVSRVLKERSFAVGARVELDAKPGRSNTSILVTASNDGFKNFRTYFKDSTGVNPNYTSDSTDYPVNTPVDVTIPDGYDTIWIWGNSSLATKNVTVKILDWKDSLGDKVHALSEKVVGIESDVVDNFNAGEILLSGSIENNSRLDKTFKTSRSELDIIVRIASNYSQQFRLYFKDSSGTNPNNTNDTTDYPTDKILHVTVPNGYDTVWLFYSGVNSSGSAAAFSVVRPFVNGLRYAVDKIDGYNFLRNKKIVFIGDSITQYKTEGKGYVDWVQILTGAVAINAGVGGTRYAPRSSATLTPSSSDEAYGDLDIYNRVHAWCENDYSYVDAGVNYLVSNNITNPTEFVNALKNNPVGSVDAVVLFAGTNDWSGSVALGDSGSTDTTTTLGALNKCVQEIYTVNPNIKLFVITPIVRYVSNVRDDEHWSDNYQNTLGKTVKDEAKAIQDECILNKVPVLDAYNTLGWGKYNFSAYFQSNDGTHPYKGFKSLATKIVAFLQGAFF